MHASSKTFPRLFLTASAAALCAFTVLPTRLLAQAPEYSVTVLTSLGGVGSEGWGINASGQVTGYSRYATGSGAVQAVVWTGTTPTNIGSLDGNGGRGYGINASGQVVGYSSAVGVAGTDGAADGAVWTGAPVAIPTLGGIETQGVGINTFGQITGFSLITGNSAYHAVRWDGTTLTDLGTPGGTNSFGYGINDSGQVAGNSGNVAVVWTGTTPTLLGTLGGSNSTGYGINAFGQVAGVSETAAGFSHAVRWTGTIATDLGTLGGASSVGYSINDSGDVDGMSDVTSGGTQDAFLYTGGTMYDLNTLLVPGSAVSGLTIGNLGNSINDLGQIAAWGTIDGQQDALLLTPVATPEPASAVLILSGVALLGLRRRLR